jgi:hypothetical protein
VCGPSSPCHSQHVLSECCCVCSRTLSHSRLVRSIDACSQARTSGTTGCSGSSAPMPLRGDDPIPSSVCDAASQPPAPVPTKDSHQHSNVLLVIPSKAVCDQGRECTTE